MLPDTITSVVVALITGYAVLSSSFVKAAYQEDINGWVGNTVRLPCLVDTKTCGNLHSIKWYRGSSRIFMYSGIANFRKPEGDYERRANFVYQENDTTSYLEVNNIKINDEAVYKCEITYLDVAENCLVVQFINLTTLIAPSFLKITKENGDEVKNGATIGPFNEDSSLTLVCAVAEGKPIPLLRWFKNGAEVSGVYKPEIGSNIMGAATNEKRITVSRNDLGAVYECRATSHALNQSMTAAVDINVNVKPLKMNLSGLENPVRQNTTVVLQCVAQQAKPAAVLTWYNASRRLDEKENQISQNTETNSVTRTKVIKNPDGTFNTVSRLRFTATRYENTKIFRCIASNDVMKEQDRPSFERKITVDVLYPPIITIVPDRITVNESANVYLNCTHDSNPFYIEERFWYFNGQKLTKNITLYEMRDNTLFLKRVNHKSMGKYFCGLRNSVGATNSSEIELNVLYPPTVYVEADNPVTVNESAAANVSLFCRVLTGNPRNLSNVQWYFNGKPMYKYPNASNLFLEKVQRGHHGNYSCAGMTDAGWGPQSVSKEVVVQYEPGPANVSYRVEYANGTSYNMDVIVKGTVVYLTCHVATLGRPNATVYHWYEGANEIFKDVNGSELKLSSVGVKSKLNNYSCSAQNAAGFGPNATVSLNIGAPPSIITSTKFFYVTRTDKETTLSCDIECDPRCDIYWLKDNVKLVNDDVYQVRNEVVPATLERNDFECIRSELRLNLEKFPGGHAEPYRDDAKYTCRSSPNAVGPAVSTDIEFKVYFAPTNVTVRQTKVQVTDNRIPPKVTCSAVGRPEPTFRWYNGSSNATFSQGATLSFNAPLSRDASTNFTCEAHNSYGIDTTVVYFEILYKPVCSIRITKSEDKRLLLCEADGNPSPYLFNWTSLVDDENVNIHRDERGSFLEIESMAENRVYNCTATNDINTSDPCSIEVPASEDWWLFRMFRSYDVSVAYLIIAVIVIVIALVVCVLIIFICRKRRANEKYINRIDLPNKQNYEANNAEGATITSSTLPKWPLKPGVLVHVNNNHSLSARRLQSQSNGGAPTTVTRPINGTSSNDLSMIRGGAGQNLQFYSVAGEKRCKREQMCKYKTNTLPGVFHGKTGVVSFKRFDNAVVPAANPRKRKKPGSGPTDLVGKNQNNYHSPSDALLQPDHEKTFYENLPFHGMQTPPNKSDNDKAITRPSSAQSQYDGSSGYGSTRSHRMPDGVATEPSNGDDVGDKYDGVENGTTATLAQQQQHQQQGKFNSYRRPRRLKRNWPQFRSLRSGGTSKKCGKTTMSPITERLPTLLSSSRSAAVAPSSDAKVEQTATDKYPKIMPKPIPASRKVIGFSFNKPSAKHIYQNVPIPITPNTVTISAANIANVVAVKNDESLAKKKQQPFRPEFSDLDYADVDDRSYGPINYKAASIYEAQKRQQHESETEPEDYLL